MNNPVIYWVIGGLLTLFFFFLTYKFTQTWRVWHVLFALFMFFAALGMCVMAALTLRTHNTWRTQHTRLSAQLGQEQQTRDELLHGTLREVVQTTPSIRSMAGEERRVLIDRGRVWRGVQPIQVAPDDTVTVNTAVARAPDEDVADADAAPAEPEAAAAAVEQNMILHVFIEDQAPAEENLPAGTKVPRFFIGQFTAVAVAPTGATLRPITPLDPVEKQAMRRGNMTWALYETMPVDQHQIFSVNPGETADLNQSADEAPVFGQMDEARLQRLFPPPSREQAPSDAVFQQFQERYVRMVTPYLRDGRRALEDDAPQNVWLKVRFTQAYKEEVDTAGEPVGAVVSSQIFFDRGRAEIAVLQRGKAVEFKKGDVGVFPQEDAARLINQEKVCDLIEPVFVRTLNDYEFGLKNIQLQMAQLDKARRQLLRDTAEATRASELSLEQTRLRTEERQRVTEDLQMTRREHDHMTQYAARLEGESNQLREELRTLYRVNSELAAQLAQLDRELTERIDRNATAAVTSAP